MQKKEKYWVWLSNLKLKKITYIKLLEKYKDPEKIYNLEKLELHNNDFLQNEEIEKIVSLKNMKKIEYFIEYMKNKNIKIITINDEKYPQKLKNIYDYPILLYYKGNIEILKRKSIAIIGSRDCTQYGINMAKKIANELSNRNIYIVSGLARGIDTCAHIGAIKEKAKTIAVLGNGLDSIYPSENKELSEIIIDKGGLILSEYIIGTKPEKKNFPERNRIISGIANGVVVVEAKEKSGSLITVDFALEQGRDVYAVPRKYYK